MPKPVLIILICGAGFFICLGLYYFVDNILNGTVVDWFERNYILQRHELDDSGNYAIIRQPDYAKLKTLLLFTLIIIVLLWIITILSTIHFHTNSRVKSALSQASRLIRSFMDSDTKDPGIFPDRYSEIATQMVDIKNTVQKHEQLLKEEANRKNDLIAYLAHDLKTPLTSIIGYLSLLDEAPDMPTEQRTKYVDIALDKAYRLENLTNEFFEITRYNLQQIRLEKTTIDLHYMLVQMTDEFYPLLQNHGNTVDMLIDPDMTVYGDRMKLARVFNNILKNAVAYSYPHTVITIWAEDTDEGIIIYFRNKGKTIPPQKLETIFEKFFRLDQSRDPDTGGAGLGLAIAKDIVNLHLGHIKADSKNEITTFSVFLPHACD